MGQKSTICKYTHMCGEDVQVGLAGNAEFTSIAAFHFEAVQLSPQTSRGLSNTEVEHGNFAACFNQGIRNGYLSNSDGITLSMAQNPQRFLFDIFGEDHFSDDHEKVALVHKVQQLLESTLYSSSIAMPPAVVKDFHLSSRDRLQEDDDVDRNTDEVDRGTPVEFMARSSSDMPVAMYLQVYYNDCVLLCHGVRLTSNFCLYRFVVPAEEPVWNIALVWYSGEPEGAATAARISDRSSADAVGTWRGSLALDAGFGIRVRGRDLLHSVRLEVDDTEEDQPRSAVRRGKLDIPFHRLAREGVLSHPSLVCRAVAESSLEFIVWGKTGRESVDVYVNGTTVPIELGVQLSVGRRLLRYSLAPCSVAITSVVFAVRLSERKAGDLDASDKLPEVIIDPSFGVMVGGQDCLSTTTYIDGTGTRNPFGWQLESLEATKLQSGRWVWEGLYHLRAYRRTARPREREPPR